MSLIKALELYTRLKGMPYTEESLMMGLPYAEDPMDFDLLERSASRIGLEIKKEQRTIPDLYHFALPCIILLKDNTWAMILRVTDKFATIIDSQNDTESRDIPIEELSEYYAGEAIFFSHTLKPQSDYFSVMGWFWDVIKKHKKLYIQAAIASGLINIFLIIATFYALTVYDRVIPHQGYETLWVLTFGVIIIYLFDAFLKVLRAHFIDHASKKIDIQIGGNLFERIMNTRMADRPASSSAMAFHLKEFESLREFLSSTTLVVLSDLPYTFLLLIVIGLIGGYIVIIPIIAIIAILITSFIIQPSLSEYVKRLNKSTENKYSIIINSIQNLEIVKTFNMHRNVQTQWENALSSSSESGNQLRSFNHIISSITSFIQNVCFILIIVTGVYMVSKGELTFGGMIACSMLVSRSLAPISQLTGLVSRLNQSILSIKELGQIMSSPQERRYDIAYQPKTHLQGTVQFINVDFSYPRQRLKSIKNFSIKIPSGARIGLIGRIGSGKTTFEKLLMGLYHPSSGHILVDGIDIAQIDPVDLRKHIGYVPQDITLWKGTLKYNILSGDMTIPDEQFEKICELSGVMDFVRMNPLGFNMPISEDGTGLSQGQKQSLAVARALVRGPKILLMDEPTANMDPQSENNLLTRLNTYLTDETLIMITHRMNVLSLVNRVVLLEQGQILMDGPRDEVMARLNASNSPTVTDKKTVKLDSNHQQ